MTVQTQTHKWDKERVMKVLKDVYHVEEYEDRSDLDRDIDICEVEIPCIYYDGFDNRLFIEYPDENEEIPNPYSSLFYPEYEYELEKANTVDEIKEILENYLPDDKVEGIIERCMENGRIDKDCVIENAYDETSEEIEKEAEEEIKKIRSYKPKEKKVCGVSVFETMDIREEYRNDGIVDYTALIPSTVYIIDLNNVPDEKTLKCILENI